MGKFFFHVMAALAELERGMISERTKAGMAARKAKDPGIKWGMKHWFTDHPKRVKHIQGLYNAGEFRLVDRPAGGVSIKGMSAIQLMAEANAADPKARKISSAETIRRWLREGAPGLDYITERTTQGASMSLVFTGDPKSGGRFENLFEAYDGDKRVMVSISEEAIEDHGLEAAQEKAREKYRNGQLDAEGRVWVLTGDI